jgi:hypothetical protein
MPTSTSSSPKPLIVIKREEEREGREKGEKGGEDINN